MYKKRKLVDKSKILAEQSENFKILSFKEKMLENLTNDFIENTFNSELSKNYRIDVETHSTEANFFISYEKIVDNYSYSFYLNFNIHKIHNKKNLKISKAEFNCEAFSELKLCYLKEMTDILQKLEQDFNSINHEEYCIFINEYFNLYIDINKYKEEEKQYKKILLTLNHKDIVNKVFEVFPALREVNPIKNTEDLQKFINNSMDKNLKGTQINYYIELWDYYFNGDLLISYFPEFTIKLSEEEPENLEKATFSKYSRECTISEFIEKLNELPCFNNGKVIEVEMIAEHLTSKKLYIPKIPENFKFFFDKYEQYKLTNKLEKF